MSNTDNTDNTNKVKYILSKEGSSKFKAKLRELDNLHVENIGIETAMDIVKQINNQKVLLQTALTNPIFTKHEKETIQTYIDEAILVADSLQRRTHQYTESITSVADPNFPEVDGGRRKTRRRKTRRRKTVKKSVRRRR